VCVHIHVQGHYRARFVCVHSVLLSKHYTRGAVKSNTHRTPRRPIQYYAVERGGGPTHRNIVIIITYYIICLFLYNTHTHTIFFFVKHLYQLCARDRPSRRPTCRFYLIKYINERDYRGRYWILTRICYNIIPNLPNIIVLLNLYTWIPAIPITIRIYIYIVKSRH